MARFDAAIFAGDTAKAEQTLGPLRQGLHRFEAEIEAVRALLRALLRALHAEAPRRTSWLASAAIRSGWPGAASPTGSWCFGLENAGDAKFGLSEAQRDAYGERRSADGHRPGAQLTQPAAST
ncbi:hypothetical protein [Microtetraspora niveoalba]|uniref:hypothetical protein n=1 Tax=Microtetraspora niveoalba TaxID=46175 RepID=UPI000ABC6C1E|nr:hypothetical protein [Microtetraspora niveoalba]